MPVGEVESARERASHLGVMEDSELASLSLRNKFSRKYRYIANSQCWSLVMLKNNEEGEEEWGKRHTHAPTLTQAHMAMAH